MTEVLATGSGPGVSQGRVARLAMSGPWAVVPDLARRQGLRMLRHPVLLLGAAWFVLGYGIGGPTTPYDRYSAVTGMLAFMLGPGSFFAANLVASSDRRCGAEEWTPSLPMPAVHRTAALLLACLVPAAAVGMLDLAAVALVGPHEATMPLLWQHVASVPLVVLGATVLGVAVARLLPWPGVPLAVMVGLVVFNARMAGDHSYLGFYVDFAEWTPSSAAYADVIPPMRPGSPSWHLIYLAALCGLAACGALLRDARRWWLPFTAGGVLGALVLVAGALQLP
jgi:hypothetical protein